RRCAIESPHCESLPTTPSPIGRSTFGSSFRRKMARTSIPIHVMASRSDTRLVILLIPTIKTRIERCSFGSSISNSLPPSPSPRSPHLSRNFTLQRIPRPPHSDRIFGYCCLRVPRHHRLALL